MKKVKLIFSFFVILILFASCNFYETCYESVTDLKEVRAKTSMEPFDDLNEPIVITMPVYEKMALFGNESMGYYSKRAGDIFVVYDWENNKIHDWLFFEGNHGWSNFRAAEMGTPVKYYDSGDKIGCLDSGGNLTVYKNDILGTFTNLNNNHNPKSRYGLLNTDGYSDGLYEYRINIFDSETGKTNKNQIKMLSESSNLFFPFADDKGNYWICSFFSSDDKKKSVLNKIDGENNKITAVKEFDESYRVKETFKDYIILRSEELREILVYNIKKDESIKIEYPRVSHEFSFYIGVVANDEIYGIFTADKDNDEYAWRETTEIHKIDIENKRLIKEEYEFDYDCMTETVYSRGSRIYLLNSRDLSKFVCSYYDVVTKEKGLAVEISLEEILEGKKELRNANLEDYK